MTTRTRFPGGVPCWVGVLAPDVEAAREFYGALFGWTFDDIADADAPPFYVAGLGGDRVAGVAGPVDPGTWIFAVSVPDVDETARVAVRAGGTAPGPVAHIPTLGRFRKLLDPDGAEVHIGQLLAGGTDRVDEPGAWSRISRSGGVPATVASFYASLFGWRLEGTTFRVPGDPTGPAAVVGGTDPGDTSTGAVWTPEFRVADAATVVETAAARGGRVVTDRAGTGTGHRTAVLVDPGGARFSISQRPAG